MSRAKVIIDETGETLIIDATQSERHDRKASVAKHPLEGGGQIVDHAETNLEKITIKGVITPLDFPDSRVILGEGRKDKKAREFLERAAEKQLRLVTLRYGVIQPVVLERWPQNVEAPLDSTNVTLSFRKVVFAEWKQAQLPPDQVQSETMASKCSCGTKTPTESTSEEAGGSLEKLTGKGPAKDKSAGRAAIDKVINFAATTR